MRRYLLILFACVLVTSCKQDSTTEFVKEIRCYSDYSTVVWSDLSEKYYRPNAGDWGEDIEKCICTGFPLEIASYFWHLLQNARTDFHQKSLPLRAEASKEMTDALDNTEAMFDTVFVRCISQEYYMRLFPEMYNETMKPAIDKLVIEINSILF